MSFEQPTYGGLENRPFDYYLNGTISRFSGNNEQLNFTFPVSIVPKYYTISFSSDSIPAVWYLFGKSNGTWYRLDSKNLISDPVNKKTNVFNYVNNTWTYPINNDLSFDSIRLAITGSTGRSTKIREFSITDQVGKYIPFLVPFCTDTTSMYHTGSLNFSKLDSFSLDAKLQTDFYAVGYDFIELENGMMK